MSFPNRVITDLEPKLDSRPGAEIAVPSAPAPGNATYICPTVKISLEPDYTENSQ